MGPREVTNFGPLCYNFYVKVWGTSQTPPHQAQLQLCWGHEYLLNEGLSFLLCSIKLINIIAFVHLCVPRIMAGMHSIPCIGMLPYSNT